MNNQVLGGLFLSLHCPYLIDELAWCFDPWKRRWEYCEVASMTKEPVWRKAVRHAQLLVFEWKNLLRTQN